MLKELVKKSRSIRRFYGDKAITIEQLKELVDLARLSPYGGNKQALKYALICEPELNAKVYENLFWAGYLTDWDGPVEEERPTAYIIMLRDKALINGMTIDEGIAAQSIFLGAYEMGLGGCYFGSIKREEVKKALNISDNYDIALIIALGYPKEEVVIDDVKEDGDIKYYRDENKVHHVPKRKLEDLIIQINES